MTLQGYHKLVFVCFGFSNVGSMAEVDGKDFSPDFPCYLALIAAIATALMSNDTLDILMLIIGDSAHFPKACWLNSLRSNYFYRGFQQEGGLSTPSLKFTVCWHITAAFPETGTIISTAGSSAKIRERHFSSP